MAMKTQPSLAAVPDRANTAVREVPRGAHQRVANLIRGATCAPKESASSCLQHAHRRS